MIIRIIPENDAEKARFMDKFGSDKIEHTGVREYLIFGNKAMSTGEGADFHEWAGTYRYLVSSLSYFYEVLNDERRNNTAGNTNVTDTENTRPISAVEFEKSTREIFNQIDRSKIQAGMYPFKDKGMLKTGGVEGATIQPIDVEPFRHPKVIPAGKIDEFFEEEEKSSETFEENGEDKQLSKGPKVIPANKLDRMKFNGDFQ